MTNAPIDYTPAYCEAVRQGCKDKMEIIDQKVNKVDSRMWALIMLAGSNLIASVGGLVFYILSTQGMQETLAKSIQLQIPHP